MLTLWDLLFKPGFYAYSDQHFPLTSALQPSDIISLSIGGGFQFDRIVISWPYYLVSIFTKDIKDLERVFLYYTFVLYSALCYVFSEIAVRFYSNHIASIPYGKQQMGKIPIFLVAYSNLSALNLNADGGTWADSVILILIAISIFMILENSQGVQHYLPIASFLILTFLLDPDYALMFFIALISLFISSGIIHRKILRNVYYAMIIVMTAIVPLVFLYFQSGFISPIAQGGFAALGYRSFTYSTVKFFASNINYLNVLILLGHSWSTLTYSPPSILLYGSNISSLHFLYYPAQVLFPPGIITNIWFASVISIPFFAFLSLLFKTTRKTAATVFPVIIVAYIITQESSFPFIYSALHLLVNIPLIGSAIGTSLALPGHFINLIAFGYLTLFSLSFLTVLIYVDRINFNILDTGNIKSYSLTIRKKIYQTTSKKDSVKVIISIIIVIFLVSLAGWQAFNGSMYPMRSFPGSYLVGNSVEAKGALSPTEISKTVLDAYNTVLTNYSLSNFSLQYNTLWIGGPEINGLYYALPPLSVSLEGFKYIVENDLYSDTMAYLEAHSVRYVVVSNQDIQPETPNPFSLYGFNNYSSALIFFISSHLKDIFTQNETSIFETSGEINSFYTSNLILNATSSGQESVLYAIFKNAGYNVTFSGSGISTGINNETGKIDIISPEYLSLYNIAKPSRSNFTNVFNNSGRYEFTNSDLFPGYVKYYQNNSLGQYTVYLPGNFTTTEWHGNTSFIYNNGSICANSANATMSIGYNDALAGQSGGVKLLNSSRSVVLHLGFDISFSKNFRGTSYVNLLGESSNTSISTLFTGYRLNTANSTQYIQFNATIPEGTTYTGFRIYFNNYYGTVYVSDINLSLASASGKDNYSPMGYYMEFNNTSFTLPTGFSTEYILISRNIINVSAEFSFDCLTTGDNRNISGLVYGVILIKNGSLVNYSGDYVTIDSVLTNSYNIITKNGIRALLIRGDDGSYIIEHESKTNLIIKYKNLEANELYIYYIVIIILMLTLLLRPFLKKLAILKNDVVKLFINHKRGANK